MISYEDAGPELRAAFDRTRGPKGTLDNVMRVHSLRPSAMAASKALYKAALHDTHNSLPTWLQEVIASYVSVLNNAPYSFTNHWANAVYLIADQTRSDAIRAALEAETPAEVFDGRELALLCYAQKLTRRPGAMDRQDVETLKEAGLTDGEILEATQIIGYFNYVNRILNGLGVSNDGEDIGFY